MTSIVLWVSDIDRQANFYSVLLGASISDKSEEFCSVSDERNSVLLHLLPEQYRLSNTDLQPAQEEVAIKPIFEVASIDDALARVNAYGVRVSGAMATYGQASYQDCIDPEGNVIQLCQQS